MCAVLYTFSIIIFYLPHFILHMLIFYISLGVMQVRGGGEGGWLKSTTVANLAAAAGFITDLF